MFYVDVRSTQVVRRQFSALVQTDLIVNSPVLFLPDAFLQRRLCLAFDVLCGHDGIVIGLSPPVAFDIKVGQRLGQVRVETPAAFLKTK